MRSDQKPSEDEIKEVYARFGAAYYHAEVVHRGLCNLLVVASLPIQGATAPRVDELTASAFATTLGQLVTTLREGFSEPLPPNIDDALTIRNYLAHYFWFDRVHMLSTADGCAALVAELAGHVDFFREVDVAVDALQVPHLERLGLSDAWASAVSQMVSSPTPPEPLPDVRGLRKRETLVEVYEVPVETGGMNLVFELEDGTLWELCDVGIGWTRHRQVSTDWAASGAFRGLLPVDIRPKPTTTSPWNFDIALGNRGTLVVRRPSGETLYRWSVRRIEEKR